MTYRWQDGSTTFMLLKNISIKGFPTMFTIINYISPLGFCDYFGFKFDFIFMDFVSMHYETRPGSITQITKVTIVEFLLCFMHSFQMKSKDIGIIKCFITRVTFIFLSGWWHFFILNCYFMDFVNFLFISLIIAFFLRGRIFVLFRFTW